ncbi:type I 3-dehydroquinate dehydratase [Liquorilactobacillus satsumensis]|uniref:type I 3-dehydroquinate dehydratase n=1 Tax=Liquorilactobacillus satsumensis TaxID=259059 RepID=UPI0021C38C18|nr:type I 3-dehydroquinate dehydratase [Liquorilactobacillus satsumensis]MCP9328536.1 type I 3-dehydroquinate dehydratase [Liquorilactobacillus satsumensis]
MLKKLQVKQTLFKSGETKIAVPLTAPTPKKLLEEARKAVAAKPDVIEWRIDFYKNVLDQQEYRNTQQQLTHILGKIPLLTTFRTQHEGGVAPLSDEQYFKLMQWISLNQLTDLLDLELNRDASQTIPIISAAHRAGLKIIISNHEFQQTPSEEEIITRLQQMATMHADIAKIAVMPKNAADVLTLLNATYHADQQISIPLITMAMGQLGKLSRISGSLFGSVLSFASVGEASAPGQLTAATLRKALEILSAK